MDVALPTRLTAARPTRPAVLVVVGLVMGVVAFGIGAVPAAADTATTTTTPPSTTTSATTSGASPTADTDQDDDAVASAVPWAVLAGLVVLGAGNGLISRQRRRRGG